MWCQMHLYALLSCVHSTLTDRASPLVPAAWTRSMQQSLKVSASTAALTKLTSLELTWYIPPFHQRSCVRDTTGWWACPMSLHELCVSQSSCFTPAEDVLKANLFICFSKNCMTFHYKGHVSFPLLTCEPLWDLQLRLYPLGYQRAC